MTDVVIAGAGPNGLMLACELALAGVTPVVLDSLPGPSSEPKANGLVGQVVRALDLRGLYGMFTGEDGPPQPTPAWMFSGMQLKFLGLSDNPMNAMLMPQPRLVRMLEKHALDLGVDLRWGHELTGLQAHDDGVTLTVTAEGYDYPLVTDYLVGADGGRSFVRKSTGIGFPGVTSPTVARLAHVHIPDELRGADGGLDIAGFGPLRFGHNRFDRGMVIFAEFDPGRALLGTIGIRLGPRAGADVDCRAADELAQGSRASTCRWKSRGGPDRMRCGGSTGRTPARPIGTATGGFCCSATPPMCTRPWVVPA